MLFTLKIASFTKFNTRNDVKIHTWFRLQNSWIRDPEFTCLPPQHRLAWIALLSYVSEKQREWVRIDTGYLSGICGGSEDEMVAALDWFHKLGLIEIDEVDEKPSTGAGIENTDVRSTSQIRNSTEQYNTIHISKPASFQTPNPSSPTLRSGDQSDEFIFDDSSSEKNFDENKENTNGDRLPDDSATRILPDRERASDAQISNDQETPIEGATIVDDQTTGKKDAPLDEEKTGIKGVGKSTHPKPKKRERKKKATPDDNTLAMKWAAWANEHHPHIKVNVGRWAEELAKVKRVVTIIDEKTKKPVAITQDQLTAVFDFVKEDNFWFHNAQSPLGLLRPGSNGCRKIENIISAIRRKYGKELRAMSWLKKYNEDGSLKPEYAHQQEEYAF